MSIAAAMAPEPPEKPFAGQILLWTSAAAAALAVHGGLAFWAMRNPPDLAGEAAPEAVMIELAPDPIAPLNEPPEIASDLQDAEKILPPTPEVAPDVPTLTEMPEPVDPEPLPDLVQDLPPALPDAVPVPEPEIALPPPARPERIQSKTAVEDKQKVPEKEARRAKAAAAAGPKVAAPTNSTATVGAAAQAKWQSRLMSHLERRKRYPSEARSRRSEGTAQVRFSIDDAGNVLSVALVRSAGDPELDAEVVALIRRASPVPAPPEGASHTITAPVSFRIR